MAKVAYDLSGVEDMPEEAHAPVGTYIAEIEAVDSRDSSKGNPMLEVRLRPVRAADGSKLKETYAPIWEYPLLEHESKFVMAKTKQFLDSLGSKAKGTLDTDKMVGKKIQVKLKSDTDEDGDYRPRVGKWFPVNADNIADAETGPEPEPDEPEPETAEEEAIDLDALDRNGLKAFIRDEGLGTLADLGINTKTTDDQIREIIVEQMGGEAEPEPEPESEPEPEPEPEPEGGEVEVDLAAGGSNGDGYNAMSVPDLRKELAERELETKGNKTTLITRLREDDGSSPF